MVFVLDKRRKPLMPCSERRARILPSRGRAVLKAVGRCEHQRTNPDKSGFPRGYSYLARHKSWEGFRSGDLVRGDGPAVVGHRKRKTAGRHVGPLAIRTWGSLRAGNSDGLSSRYCSVIQRADGSAYSSQKGGSDASSPRLKPGASGVA